MFQAQLIGRTVEIAREVFNGANVAIDGGLSVVAPLELFEHDLA
jgi:hypothetical protein